MLRRGNATTEIFIPDRLIVRLKILAVDSWLCDGYIICNLIVMLYKAWMGKNRDRK